MRARVVGVVVAVGLFFLAPSARAEVGGDEAREGRVWSITLSPIHLVIGPIAEVTAERKVGPKLGAALMVGGGKFTSNPGGSVDTTYDVFEAGASVRVYLFGTFERGVQLGASAEYMRLSGDDVNGSGVSAIGNGTQLSAFIGYKHVWSMGITFDGQLGPSFLAVRGESGGSASEDSRLGVNLNLNVGWSF